MSENKYPWVVPFEGSWHEPAAHGTHKVVPADAIVIERGDLPTMTVASARVYVTNSLGYTSTLGYESTRIEITADLLDRAEAHARHMFAVIDYLRANPPVDEAQVKALTEALYAAGVNPTGSLTTGIAVSDVARRLVKAGLRAPEVTE